MNKLDCKHHDMATIRPELHKADHALAGTMLARRRELGLNQSRAAKLAEVARPTWVNWETGAAVPYDSNYVKIERALEWAPGSVQTILAGGQPQALDEANTPMALPIDPAALASYDPADRAAVIAVVAAAERRAAAKRDGRHSNEGQRRRTG